MLRNGEPPTGTVPVFLPVLPPKIKSISHEALVRWKKERRDYETKLRNRCRVTGEDYDAVVEQIKDSFDADLLDVFCEFQLNVETVDVTEGMLTAEIEHIVGSVKNKALPDIKELFKRELKMNLAESDVTARVMDYFKCFKTIVADNGLTECFSLERGTREKCKRLISALKPPMLKQEVKQSIRYTHAAAERDPKVLFRLIVEKATELEKQYIRLKTQKREASGREEKPKAKQPSKPKDKQSRPAEQMKVKASLKDNKTQDAKPKSSTKPPPGPCPKCEKMHWLRECPEATEDEKAELLKRFRNARKAKKARTKRLGELLPTADRTVLLNGVLELPYCPDSGLDYTVIGQSHWKQLLALDPEVPVKQLEVPIQSQTFGDKKVTAVQKAMIQVRIHTAVGPVEPMNLVDVLIVDCDDDEFIVGNDLLTLLGISVDRQLEQLASRGDDELAGDPIHLEADEMPVQVNEPSPSDDADIFAAVEKLIDRAVDCGFPLDHVEQLRTIVHAYDVWRLELRADPPANVPPMEVKLQDGAKPTKCKPRKYPPHIRKFLREFNDRLVELGLVYENPKSRWSSPVLPVKKSSDLLDLRQTVDYRLTNAQTSVMAAVMPILSLVVENASGMKHFGLFDFLKGFWQLPLAELCQEWFSYMTDEKIFTPRRVPQGSSDAAIHFQKTMEECFSSLLYKHLLIWIDDLLLYANDIDIYLEKLAEFFSLLNEFGLKLSAKKTSLYQTEVKWCGKLINGDGVRHDPERIETLRSMPYPTTAGELQQFVCAINWMRESIVDFARQVQPLQIRLDAALADTKRTKRAAAGIKVQLTTEERLAFDQVKDMLADAATLAYTDDNATTCLFTDASDVGWAVIVTQVVDFDPKTPVTQQQHKLLTYMSGTFTGSQLNWTVIEKEALPIVLACEKLDYLLLRPKAFRMFCDHRNLVHVFAPDESVKKHVKGKLLRWSMKLMGFQYIVEHVPGPDNVWADMASRWAGNHTPTVTLKRLKTIRRRQPRRRTELRPLDDDTFVWPSFAEIVETQSKFPTPASAVRSDDGVLTLNNCIWIPVDAVDLIRRLCIVAHCGSQGHRGQQAMVSHLQRLFSIDNLRRTVATFVNDCLLCLHSRGGKIIPRPWGELIECNERNKVLHFDYLYLGPSYGTSCYILALKDHASHYCELVVADSAESPVVVEALLAWHSRYGVPPSWVSDQGTHFKNEVVTELSRRLRTQQTFTPAYSPWVNGSIERINRDILQVIRAMTLEYRISQKDWVYLVPLVQSNLNHTAVPSLGNHSPLELFTGLENPTPLSEFYLSDGRRLQTIPASAEIDDYLENLRESIRSMHCAVEDRREKQRLLNKKRERGENVINFTVGDYVLRSRVDEKNGNKLQVMWVGPYQVTRADAHSFRVKHLVTGDEQDVHASRLKFYSDDSLEVTDELLEHVSSQGIVLAVEKLKGHKWNSDINDFEILIGWKGLQPIEDSYEPMGELAKEIRVLVGNYVTSTDDQRLREHWQQLQGERRDDAVRENRQQVMEARPNVDSGETPSTSDTRRPQGDARRARPRLTGQKRRRKTASRRTRGSNRSVEEVPQSDSQQTSGQTADRDGELHQGAEVQEPPPPRGRRVRAEARVGTPSRVQPSRSSRRKDRGQGS